jgi:poly(hydroxyalkanoate) depolymerase family esterase
MRALLAAFAALVLAACGNSAPVASAAPAGWVADDLDITSPKWQGVMRHHQLAGHPRWPDVVGLDGSVDTHIWPGLHYWVYVPPLAAAKQSPSLVLYLHGTSQNPERAARGVRWNELADREGFVVVYPMGDSGDNWSWGQATAYGRGAGELEAVARITAEVHANYGTNPKRTYVTGTSSGAITATMLAAMYTEFFTAVGSFLGCSYNCADPAGVEAYQAMGPHAKVVPAFLVHGTLDPLFTPPLALQADTQWVGTNDRADNGVADGSIALLPEIDDSHFLAVPGPAGGTDVCARPENNPCIGPVLGYSTYPYEIHRYRDHAGAGRTIVESWWINGLSHNYPYGDPEGNFIDPTGPDITTASFEFFEQIDTPPSAGDDAVVTSMGMPVTVDVVANDTDPDNDQLLVTSMSRAANGLVKRDGAKLTYVPRAGFAGRDAFSYVVDDGHGGSGAAQVTICVAQPAPGC